MFQFPVPVKYFFVNSRQFYLNKCCELKQCFLYVWHGTDQTIIFSAVEEWCGHLRTCACLLAKGGHLNNYCDNIQPYEYNNNDKRHFSFCQM